MKEEEKYLMIKKLVDTNGNKKRVKFTKLHDTSFNCSNIKAQDTKLVLIN